MLTELNNIIINVKKNYNKNISLCLLKKPTWFKTDGFFVRIQIFHKLISTKYILNSYNIFDFETS